MADVQTVVQKHPIVFWTPEPTTADDGTTQHSHIDIEELRHQMPQLCEFVVAHGKCKPVTVLALDEADALCKVVESGKLTPR